MIITGLKTYWMLCQVYRHSLDPRARLEARSRLEEMKSLADDPNAFRFVDTKPRVTVKDGG